MKALPRLRPTRKKLLLLAGPFPALWLYLGWTVNPIVFTPWHTQQPIGSLSYMVLAAMPILFTFFYALLLSASRFIYGSITVATMVICSAISFLLAITLTPIP